MSVEFCDTNVIVYAYDHSAGEKHTQARLLLDRLWDNRIGALSVQILQEVYVTLTRKLRQPYAPSDAHQIIADLATWKSVVEPTAHDVLEAINRSTRWNIAFWDAMVLVAARRTGTSIVWSEDLNSSQSYDGIIVQNPFRPSG